MTMIVFITLKNFFRSTVKSDVTPYYRLPYVQKASVSSPDVSVYLMYLCQWWWTLDNVITLTSDHRMMRAI